MGGEEMSNPQTCSITLTNKQVRFDNVGLLLTAKELGELLGLTPEQFNRFKHKNRIHRVDGTNKYSTVAAIEAIVGRSDHQDAHIEDPGLAALNNL